MRGELRYRDQAEVDRDIDAAAWLVLAGVLMMIVLNLAAAFSWLLGMAPERALLASPPALVALALGIRAWVLGRRRRQAAAAAHLETVLAGRAEQ